MSRERCVPGGERGSFEDHGEGDPDVLAARRGTKASMCVPLRESRIENRRPRLPGGAGSVCSANPTQPRTRALVRHPRPAARISRQRERFVQLGNRSMNGDACRVGDGSSADHRPFNIVYPRAYSKVNGRAGREGRREGRGGQRVGGKTEKVRIIFGGVKVSGQDA